MKEKHALRIPSRTALDTGAAMAEHYFKNGPTAVQMNEVGLQRLLVDAYEAGRCEAAKTCHELTEQNKALAEALKEALDVIEDYLNYEYSGDPYEEDARQMGEMGINEYKRSGAFDKARATLAKAEAK